MAEGPAGPHQAAFEDGLRFLATALALREDHRNAPATVSAACDAIQCFLRIFAEAAARKLPDPEGELPRLRAQCEALLTPRQGEAEALLNSVEAALLARDQAARLLPLLMSRT